MASKKNILFLNPPGDQIYIRDYYCSKVSKAYYMPQPVDLLMQTAHFDEEAYNLVLIDAIAERLNVRQALKMCIDFNPDAVIGQCGSVSYKEDQKFYSAIKNAIPTADIFCSGDAFIDHPIQKFDQNPWLSGVITNFFNDGVLKYLEGDLSEVSGLTYRAGQEIIKAREKREKHINFPNPKHHLFENDRYRMPFMNARPMATVLTNYACPFPCTFCIMSTMPFVQRSAESITSELKSLQQLGIRYVYFSDQTFYVNHEVTDQVLDYMIDMDVKMNWMCFSRVDVLDEARIKKMKRAGCNMIMFGVEWAEEAYLQKYKKHYTLNQIRETFKLTRDIGIQRLGTFLLGVPGQTEHSIKNTVEFAIELKADYASFNIAVPRSNTSFRAEAIDAGLVEGDIEMMDQSGSYIAMGTGEVDKGELARLRNWAYRRFYMRPAYVFDRITRLRNVTELRSHILEAYYIFKGML